MNSQGTHLGDISLQHGSLLSQLEDTDEDEIGPDWDEEQDGEQAFQSACNDWLSARTARVAAEAAVRC